jgi:hypothetical protein
MEQFMSSMSLENVKGGSDHRQLNGSGENIQQMRCLLTFGFAITLTACQAGGANKPANETVSPGKTETGAPAGELRISEAKPPVFSSDNRPDTGEALKFPFPDFPKVDTKAKAGDYVLSPSYNWIKDAADRGADTTSFTWYVQKMGRPDPENSELQFLKERHRVPNAYIIAIPPNQTAKKGDIVLTWWQTGSGMQRAIVVDDSIAGQPVVRYLDIDYDNPARSRDGSTPIGKMDERVVPGSFVKLKTWDAGTTVAVQAGANQKLVRVIRVAGNRILVMDAGKLRVYSRSSCRPLPLVPEVNAGDRVRAPRYGTNFASAIVSKVDTRNGRVFVRFEGDQQDEAVAFGDILKK